MCVCVIKIPALPVVYQVAVNNYRYAHKQLSSRCENVVVKSTGKVLGGVTVTGTGVAALVFEPFFFFFGVPFYVSLFLNFKAGSSPCETHDKNISGLVLQLCEVQLNKNKINSAGTRMRMLNSLVLQYRKPVLPN